MVEEMKARIEKEIKFAVIDYKQFGRTEFYERSVSKIYGMIEMLRVVTGKQYTFNENGLIEH